MTKNFSIPQIVAVFSFLFLATAYFIQYFLNLSPCKLCLYQRIPYFFLVFLGIISFSSFIKQHYKIVLLICRVIIIVEIFLAIYHVGIERNIFPESSACKIESSTTQFSVDDLRQQIYQNTTPSCKEVSMRILGLSLAEINLILTLLLLGLTFIRYFYHIPFTSYSS